MRVSRLPSWLKKDISRGKGLFKVKDTLSELGLNTVCQGAKCPNIGECFGEGVATFMIMGSICTRNCRFCAVEGGDPNPLELDEPVRIAQAAKILGLTYVVVTSVTRDDLPDGGAEHFSKTITAIRESLPYSKVEVLVPDFKGSHDAVWEVVKSSPTVFSHNMETVSRLYPRIRPGADYCRSLNVLEFVKDFDSKIVTKSGLMLGLGETREEVLSSMKDLRNVGCDVLTMGQYLRPSDYHFPEERFLHPEEFKELESIGKEMGFQEVASGPFVRSSYHAGRLLERILPRQEKDNGGR
ncbi:MAG: lipoyl synthase [Desulfobacterales bacterium]|nr:lipoyl synthase [Desulfobacterales bacterium]